VNEPKKVGEDDGRNERFRANLSVQGGVWVSKKKAAGIEILNGKYSGELKKLKGGKLVPHGAGKAKYGSRCEYDGQWVLDKMQGEGRMTYPDGGVMYDGQWEGGVGHGRGQMVRRLDEAGTVCVVYSGEWVRGERHGEGKYIFENGCVYNGQWVRDKMHGYGKYVQQSGNRYHGQFKDGRKHGNGLALNRNGQPLWGGQWRHDKPIHEQW